jgi:hypothetical protein
MLTCGTVATRFLVPIAVFGLACTRTPSSLLDARTPSDEGIVATSAAVEQPEHASPPPSPSVEPVADPTEQDPVECPPASERAGFERCVAVELTGAAPCEAICSQARRAAPSRCCDDPVDAVIFSGERELLRVAACGFVSPECAHQHGHGNMDANLRVLEGPTEVVVVEGGCEARAMMHGYVPPGVAAWTGCDHTRYRWDGERFVAQ